jgi:vacuolar-type H+-ATPase subunit H
MSTSKEQRREKQEETTIITPSTSTSTATATVTTVIPSQVQRDQQQSVNRALDETKDNIKKATDEVRKDIPRYTQAVNDYQEQTIQSSREIADNFLESQKEIINSLQSAWLPQIDAANRVLTSNWVSPRHLVGNYARVVSSFADNTIAVTRLVNNTIFANLEAFKTSVQNARDNAKEFSRIAVNAARTLEQTSRDTTRASGHDDTSSIRIHVEREEQQQTRL